MDQRDAAHLAHRLGMGRGQKQEGCRSTNKDVTSLHSVTVRASQM
jgi:hypothetical protein